MIAIVDYGMGNLASVANMLRRVGAPATVTSDPAAVASATKLILPGVGAFDLGIRSLRARGLVEPLRKRALEDRVPILGICLGLQLMARRSEEGTETGLGWLAADCVRFAPGPGTERLKVPLMGWARIHPRRDCALLADLPPEPRFYFVHSYHLRPDDPGQVLAEAVHGRPFPAAVGAGNLLGVQFHPEKSHSFGMRLLRNFAERC